MTVSRTCGVGVFRTVVDAFSLQRRRRSVRDSSVQHTFLLQVREADNESVHPVPCEVCCELALQTVYALS